MLGGIQEKYQKVKNKNILAALEFQNASQGFFAFLHELGHFNNVQQTFKDAKLPSQQPAGMWKCPNLYPSSKLNN